MNWDLTRNQWLIHRADRRHSNRFPSESIVDATSRHINELSLSKIYYTIEMNNERWLTRILISNDIEWMERLVEYLIILRAVQLCTDVVYILLLPFHASIRRSRHTWLPTTWNKPPSEIRVWNAQFFHFHLVKYSLIRLTRWCHRCRRCDWDRDCENLSSNDYYYRSKFNSLTDTTCRIAKFPCRKIASGVLTAGSWTTNDGAKLFPPVMTVS